MCTRENVGDVIDSCTPRPRANPLANWVFPAPRSPISPITVPNGILFESDSPRCCVSIGLCEMKVAMRVQRSHAIAAADQDTWSGSNLSNASQRQIGKAPLPGIQQADSIAAGEGK